MTSRYYELRNTTFLIKDRLDLMSQNRTTDLKGNLKIGRREINKMAKTGTSCKGKERKKLRNIIYKHLRSWPSGIRKSVFC